MRIRSAPLTPWQRKLLGVLMRRWQAVHGPWPSQHVARQIRNGMQKAIKWNYLGRNAARHTRRTRDDWALPRQPLSAERADTIAKRHVLRILCEEQAGKWEERKKNLALVEAGLWEKKTPKRIIYSDHT